MRSATQTDQPRSASGVKYVTKTTRVLDQEVTSRVFSKVLICSRETEALGFDGEISVFSLLYKFSLLCRPPGLDGNKISDVEPIP